MPDTQSTESPPLPPEAPNQISPEDLLAIIESVKLKAKEEIRQEQAQAKAVQNVKVSDKMKGWRRNYYNEAHGEELAYGVIDKMITAYRLWDAGGKKAADLPKNVRLNWVSFSIRPATIRMKVDQSWEWLIAQGDSLEARANKKIKYRSADYEWLNGVIRLVATKEGLVFTWCLDTKFGAGFFQAEELEQGTPVVPLDNSEERVTLDNPENFGVEEEELKKVTQAKQDKRSMPWRLEFSDFLNSAEENQVLKIDNKLSVSEIEMIESAVGAVADDKHLVLVRINNTGAHIVCSEKLWEHKKKNE